MADYLSHIIYVKFSAYLPTATVVKRRYSRYQANTT